MSDILDRMLDKWQHSEENCYEAAFEIKQLRAREARLREALEKIVRVPLWDEYKCIDIARDALGEKQ